MPKEPVYENFVLGNDNRYHRVVGIRYGEEDTGATTFCDKEFSIEDKSNLEYVPLELVNKAEICLECERNNSRIQFHRFPDRYNWKGEYEFFIRASIRTGEKRGSLENEIIIADNQDEAVNRFKEMYEIAEVHKVNYIARYDNNWKVIKDER